MIKKNTNIGKQINAFNETENFSSVRFYMEKLRFGFSFLFIQIDAIFAKPFITSDKSGKNEKTIFILLFFTSCTNEIGSFSKNKAKIPDCSLQQIRGRFCRNVEINIEMIRTLTMATFSGPKSWSPSSSEFLNMKTNSHYCTSF